MEILGSKNAFYLSHQIPTQTILLKATNSKLIFGLQEEVYFFEVLGEKNVGTRAIYPDVGYILIYSTALQSIEADTKMKHRGVSKQHKNLLIS